MAGGSQGKGKGRLTGTVVFERYEFDLSQEEQERLKQDAPGQLRRFLEEQGYEVNSVQVIRPGEGGTQRMAEPGWYHEQYPRRSNWFWVSG